MKIYNVNVYDIDQYITNSNSEFVRVRKLDKIIVVKNLFGVYEVVTNQPIIVYKDNYFMNKYHIRYAKKYGFLLGVNKSDLKDINFPTRNNLIMYRSMFIWSNFRSFIKDRSTEKQINNKVMKLEKKLYRRYYE